MATSFESLTDQIVALVRQVENTSDSMDDLVTSLQEVVACLASSDQFVKTDGNSSRFHPLLEQCAVTLWNTGVARKSAGNMPPVNNAKLRQVAFELLRACKTEWNSEEVLSQLAMMALKTIKAWLECGDGATAEDAITVAYQCLRRRMELHEKNTDSTSAGLASKTHRDLFRLHCSHAEALLLQGNQERALERVDEAVTMLTLLPQEATYLTMLCYNFGVEHFNQQKYEQCIVWQRKSYDLGKNTAAVSAKKQARTLRLLANAYLEWDQNAHLQQAMNAIALANSESCHPAGLFLKLRVMLLSNASDYSIKSGLDELCRHGDLSVDLALTAARLLQSHDRVDLSAELLEQLASRHQACPRDWGRVQACLVDILLSGDKEEQAQAAMKSCITGHRTSQALESDILKQLHTLVWQRAAHHYEADEHAKALLWYNLSLGLLGSSIKDDIAAKLHRNRASCCLATGDLKQAAAAIAQTELCPSRATYTYFLKFKLALMQDESEQARVAVEEMVKEDAMTSTPGSQSALADAAPRVHHFVCLAAQLAFEHNKRDLAMTILERLTMTSPDVTQILVALRCLIGLTLSLHPEPEAQDISTTKKYLEKVLATLSGTDTRRDSWQEQFQNELTWFIKIAWNVALQCDEDDDNMTALFILCHQLTSLGTPTLTALQRQKACLLMATASQLHLSKIAVSSDEKDAHLQAALSHITDCHAVLRRITENNDGNGSCDGSIADTTTPVLLSLYELEARRKLQEEVAPQQPEQANELPHSQAAASNQQ